ncbi:MAG: hypothetical protein V1779_10700 [bacterium]
MDEQNKIVKNLRIGKYIILVTNVVASIIFFFVYLSLKNILILLLVILLLLTALAIYLYFSKVEKKFTNMNNN